MGLDNHYLITVPRSRLDKAAEYLLQHCQLSDSQRADPLWCADRCLSMLVQPDIAIKRYLRDYYAGRYDPGYQEEKIEKFITDGQVAIGCVDTTTKITGDKAHLRFVCATTDMSDLFTDSVSIRAWFEQLCAVAGAETGIYFRENCYAELFWYKGTRHSFKISPELLDELYDANTSRPLEEAASALLKAGFDYAYEYERK